MSAQPLQNLTHPKVHLKMIPTPAKGPIIEAPPVLVASTHTVDYSCGCCGVVLLHAEPGQVHNLVIHCMDCGSYSIANT